MAATTDHDSAASVVIPADREGVTIVDDWDGFGNAAAPAPAPAPAPRRSPNVAHVTDEVLADTPYDAKPVPTVQYASLQLFINAVTLLRSRDRSFSHALSVIGQNLLHDKPIPANAYF